MQLSNRIAFTLIELLVVISIIAILAAMLLPAITMVRDAAFKTRCMTNGRNIAIAVQAYSTDNDGLMPYRHVFTMWIDPVMPYLDDQYQKEYQKNRKDVFHCPFADREISNPWSIFSRFSLHYSMNTFVRAWWREWGVWQNDQPPILMSMLEPNTVLIADSKPLWYNSMVYFEDIVDHGSNTGPWPVSLPDVYAPSVPIRLHGGGVPLISVDGHAEIVSGTWHVADMEPRFRTDRTRL